MTKAKKSVRKSNFRVGEYIVYPTHGVGKITAIEAEEIVGLKMDLYVIHFEHDKMLLRVPLAKAASVGMRKVAEKAIITKSLDKLGGRARIKRTMWSRRAQEYEAKINSGDIVAVAEVVRDLFRSENQPEQSYSERQLYEAALDRMAREIAIAEKLTNDEAIAKIETLLAASPHRGGKSKKIKLEDESLLSDSEAMESGAEAEAADDAPKKSSQAAA